MKQSKTGFGLIGTVLLSLLLLCSLFLSIPNGYVGDAARTKESAFSDDFNSSVLNTDNWTASSATDAAVKDYGGAIQMVNGQFSPACNWMGLNNSAASDGKGTPLTEDYILEMTISRDCNPSDWFGLYIGLDSPDQNFTTITGQPGNVLVFTDSSINNYNGFGTQPKEGNVTIALEGDKAMTSDGTMYAVKVVTHIKKTASATGDFPENSADIFIAPMPESGEPAYGEKVGTIDNLSLAGYFGFGSLSTGTVTVSGIKVTDGASGDVLYTPKGDLKGDCIDFMEGASQADPQKEFRMWQSADLRLEGSYFTGPLGKARVANGASIESKYRVQSDDRLISAFDLSYQLHMFSVGADGMNLIVGKNASSQTVVNLKTVDGKSVLSVGDSRYTFGEELSGANLFTFRVKTNGTADVYCNNVFAATLNGFTSVDGSIAFVSTGSDSTFEIDNVTLNVYSYVSSNSQSQAIDFTIKDKDGITYLNGENWYIGGNAMKTRYDEISFINADPNANFSTKHQYADFVLNFDLYDITQGAGGCSWIGITFAKNRYTDGYAQAPTITFAPRNENNDTGIVGVMNIEGLSGVQFNTASSMIESSYNFFQDMNSETGHERINVRLVAVNRTVTLYFKYADEPESMLSIPRAVVEDINTFGYIGICCNYNGNFAVSNFSITNLDPNRSFIADGEAEESKRVTGDASLLA